MSEEIKAEQETEQVKTITPVTPVIQTSVMQTVDIANGGIEKKEVMSDIFIGENDVFTVQIRYHKNDVKNGDLLVEGIDEDFSLENRNLKVVDFTFKYPSYNDSQTIYRSSNVGVLGEQLQYSDLIALQDCRIIVLFKSWSANEKFGETFKDLNCKIVKALRAKMSEELGMNGIL